ncbi:hypothetical protein [Candidatus Albibeggiatoa sp. nov. NOAA]|uniref:WD40 repeat domain-containing protein n=1 Tax=Candidatus Albibeggiatoa sp. nov. NOAA TaxID=3162724 RepID=UPI0032F0E3B0|nr:hypothetical protein [Thiotrichaceae bacterium]
MFSKFSKYHWLIYSCVLWLGFGQSARSEDVVEPIKTFLDTGQAVNHTESVTSIDFSPDNQWLLSGSADGTIKLWDMATGQEVRSYARQSKAITLVEFAPNGQRMLIGTSDKKWVVIDFNTGNVIQTLTDVSGNTLVGYNPHERVTFAPDSQSVFIANKATTEQWNIESGVLMRTFNSAAFPIDVSSDGKLLIAVNQNYYTPIDHSFDTQVQVIDIETSQVLQTFTVTEATDNPPKTGTIISGLQFSPNDQQILQISSRSANNDATKLWDRTTGQAVDVTLDKIANFARFSSDGTWVLFGNVDAPMDIIEMSTGNVAQTFGENTNISTVIAALSTDNQKAASFEQGELIVWNTITGSRLFTLTDAETTTEPTTQYELSTIELSPNGQWLAFADKQDHIIRFIDTHTNDVVKTFEGHSAEVQALRFTADSQRLISISQDNLLKQWEVETGLEIQNFTSQTAILDLVVAPNNQLLLLKQGLLELQDLNNALIWSQDVSSETINAMAFSADGTQVLTAGSLLSLRDATTGVVTQNFPIENEVRLVQFLPHGQSFMTADSTGLAVWDMATSEKRQLNTLGTFDSISAFSIAPNSQSVAVGIAQGASHIIPALDSYSLSIQLLDMNTGEQIRTFKGVSSSGLTSADGFDFVRFSPLGNFLYTTSSGYFDQHFEGINKWYSGLGALSAPDNNTCTDEVCQYGLPINDAGFYVAEMTLPTGETEGQWGLSINNSSGASPGGFSAGSVLRRNGEAPAFISFRLTQPTAVNLQVVDYLNKLTELSVTVKKDNTDIVYGPVTMEVGATNQTEVLEAGYYVVTVSSLVGNERSYIGVGVYGNNIQSNLDVGGMIDEETGLGFVGFYIPESMDVNFNLFYGGNYHRLGATDVKLEIFSKLEDSQQSIWSSVNQ